MNYDDELKIPDSPDIIPQIVNYIGTHHPEYLLPEASVNIEFILLVDRVKSIVLGMEECFVDEDRFYFEYDHAIEILKNLDKDTIANPLSPHTVMSIFEVSEYISYREFSDDEKDNIQSICNNSAEYNNRGNAKQNNGVTIEALEDYNKAIALSPDDVTPIWNRANLFADSEMDGLAVNDLLTIYKEMMKQNCMINSIMLCTDLSEVFIKYNLPHRAISLILKCVRDFNKYQVPNITKNDGFVVKVKMVTKNKEVTHYVYLTDFEKIILMVKELDNTGKQNPELNPLLELVKSEIVHARTSIGI